MAFDIMSLFGPQAINRLLQPVQNAQGVQQLGPGLVERNRMEAAAQPANDPWAGMRQATVDPMQTAAIPQQPAPMPPMQAQAAPQQERKPFFDEERKAMLNDIFTGWAMGSTPGESIAMGAKMVAANRGTRKNVNETVNWLKGRGMDEGQAKMLAGSPPALNEYLKQMMQPPEKVKPIEVNGRLVDPNTFQVMADFSEKTTDTQRNLEWRAQQAGLMPGTPEYQRFMEKGGSGPQVEVNLPGQPNIGTIPQGFEAIQDQQTKAWSMRPIPGGPADTTKATAAKADNVSMSTDVITGAAAKARKAYSEAFLPVTGTLGAIAGRFPETNSAEVRRQVETLKSNAKIENLQAMRAASPTGGALGAVSDSENAMLAAKAGALDPDSPNFERDLEDYERSLLRTIHGKDAGDAVFEQTRSGGGVQPAGSQGGVVDYRQYFGGQ